MHTSLKSDFTKKKMIRSTKASWKLASGELLRKQAMIENNVHILQLLLNAVTAKIEAPVVVGNKFLYACVKEICHL
jgi:hypothetical protein